MATNATEAHESPTHSDLADATRRLLRGVRVTTVDGDRMAAAMKLIDQASEVLAETENPGPYWQTGLASIDEFNIGTDVSKIFRFSPAMGSDNPTSPLVDLRVEPREDGSNQVVGTVRFQEIHNGPPASLTHGGVLALLYDDLLGTVAMVNTGGGMTGQLTITYRKPTPILETVDFVIWLDATIDERKFIARGEMRLNGELLTEAEGLFIRPRIFWDQPDDRDA